MAAAAAGSTKITRTGTDGGKKVAFKPGLQQPVDLADMLVCWSFIWRFAGIVCCEISYDLAAIKSRSNP